MTGRLPPQEPFNPVERGRQLRSDYIFHTRWMSLDFGDLLSLLWRYDLACADGQAARAAYYRAAWEALLRGLALHETDLGCWLLGAKPPLMPSLPPFVERQAPFAEDLLARAEAAANLFSLRAAVLQFEADQLGFLGAEGPAAGIQDEGLRQAVGALYLQTLPARFDELGTALTTIDDLLYEFLLAWHPRHSQTLPILIAHYGFPDPALYREQFKEHEA